jgi:Flp pilus assembly protein TadD
LQKLIALQPDLAEAHYDLGILLLQLGDQKVGQTELEKARELGYTAPSGERK